MPASCSATSRQLDWRQPGNQAKCHKWVGGDLLPRRPCVRLSGFIGGSRPGDCRRRLPQQMTPPAPVCLSLSAGERSSSSLYLAAGVDVRLRLDLLGRSFPLPSWKMILCVFLSLPEHAQAPIKLAPILRLMWWPKMTRLDGWGRGEMQKALWLLRPRSTCPKPFSHIRTSTRRVLLTLRWLLDCTVPLRVAWRYKY